MYCSHCGKEISSEDSFCKYCGNKIEYKNISDSSSITVTRKVKTLHKPIIIGIIFTKFSLPNFFFYLASMSFSFKTVKIAII